MISFHKLEHPSAKLFLQTWTHQNIPDRTTLTKLEKNRSKIFDSPIYLILDETTD